MEQIVICRDEMERVIMFFGSRIDFWQDLYQQALGPDSSGHRVYAARQIAVWQALQNNATTVFSKYIDVRKDL